MTHNSSEIFQLKHYMLLTKRAHQCTMFQTLSALMKVHPILLAICETIRLRFIPIFHYCSVLWKISCLYFLAETSHTLDKNSPSKWLFLDFWVVGWKFTKFLMSYLKQQVSFSLNFASFFNVMRDISSVLF